MSSPASPEPGAAAAQPAFRLDNEHLAFRFTATVSDRYGSPVERLPTPARLDDWLEATGLRLGPDPAAPPHLALAHRLREAIHRTGTALAGSGTRGVTDPRPEDVELINRLASEGETFPELTASGLAWRTRSTDTTGAALGLIAQHAITVFGSEDRDRIKACENPDCGGLYVDTSRARNRRWCSMNHCGNRAKKARFRGPRATDVVP
ncbi:CGNR zinc finger domain-containing protein [Brachybacterium hainanense]|uniref:CGNR zinc finger domain-containing protein n=1 Tax=Brachybacterium hainanense TaxID=1541174 RepID=A0ABV6R7P3_9MICO